MFVVMAMTLMIMSELDFRSNYMRILSALCILFIISTLGCLPIARGMPFRVDNTQIQLAAQPKGKLCFTGYQIDIMYKECNYSDPLTERFQSILNKPIADKLTIHEYDKEDLDEFYDLIFSTVSLTPPIPDVSVAYPKGQICVLDYTANMIDYKLKYHKDNTDQTLLRSMYKECLRFLTKKVNADYYISVTGDTKTDNLPSLKKQPKPQMIISIYDRDGIKIFCKSYKRDYENLPPYDRGKSNDRVFYYLEKLLIDCSAEINTDLAFIENM
jgi:hypothetical protein